MSRMGLMKGKRGEREVIQLMQPVVEKVYTDIGRADEVPKLKRNLMQSAEGGFDIVGLNWLALEVKFHETEQLNTWWAQCKRQATCGQEPVLIWRRSRVAWRVRMFGNLPLPSGQNVRCPVDITVDSFLIYLQHRLLQELSFTGEHGI